MSSETGKVEASELTTSKVNDKHRDKVAWLGGRTNKGPETNQGTGWDRSQGQVRQGGRGDWSLGDALGGALGNQ